MTRMTDSTRSYFEQAAHWWSLLHEEGASAVHRREFLAWATRSPERIGAYLEMERLAAALRARRVRWPDSPAEVLIREAKAAPPDPAPINGTARRPDFAAREADAAAMDARQRRSGGRRLAVHFRRRYVMPGMAAAAAIVAGIAGSWLMLQRMPLQYQTQRGEERSILLADGSRVTLNSASALDVEFDNSHRVVRLLRGEALFEVSHDPARPFDVHASGTVLRAIGTEFNVDINGTRTAVTVLEGRVAVMNAGEAARMLSPTAPSGQPPLERFPAPAGALILSAAERVVITPDRTGDPQHVNDLDAVTSWTRGELVFERRPLKEIVADFNRYGGQRIIIESARLDAQDVTGVIQLNDPDSLLSFLADVPGVVTRRAADGSIIVTLRDAAQTRAGPAQ